MRASPKAMFYSDSSSRFTTNASIELHLELVWLGTSWKDDWSNLPLEGGRETAQHAKAVGQTVTWETGSRREGQKAWNCKEGFNQAHKPSPSEMFTPVSFTAKGEKRALSGDNIGHPKGTGKNSLDESHSRGPSQVWLSQIFKFVFRCLISRELNLQSWHPVPQRSIRKNLVISYLTFALHQWLHKNGQKKHAIIAKCSFFASKFNMCTHQPQTMLGLQLLTQYWITCPHAVEK